MTPRLAQPLAKQAKEMVRSAHAQGKQKPRMRKHTVTLYSHFVAVEPFAGHFDWAVKLTGSGAPKMIVPINSTFHLNTLLADSWRMSRTVGLGRDHKGRLWIDFMVEKPRPEGKEEADIVGMDSNSKNGLVFSDGQQVRQDVDHKILTFSQPTKGTHIRIKNMVGRAIKKIDLSPIKMPSIEDLKPVRHNTGGKFPRPMNRRFSHWPYAYMADLSTARCEQAGVWLAKKNPAYSSIFCPVCGTGDRPNRRRDQFRCLHCGLSQPADLQAANNVQRLGVAGVYGLR